MIEEEFCDKKLTNKLMKLGYNGQRFDGLITISCAMKWLREKYNIHVMPAPYGNKTLWASYMVYLGEPMEKDRKKDMCVLGTRFSSYETAALKGIRHGAGIVEKIIDILKKENGDRSSNEIADMCSGDSNV